MLFNRAFHNRPQIPPLAVQLKLALRPVTAMPVSGRWIAPTLLSPSTLSARTGDWERPEWPARWTKKATAIVSVHHRTQVSLLHCLYILSFCQVFFLLAWHVIKVGYFNNFKCYGINNIYFSLSCQLFYNIRMVFNYLCMNIKLQRNKL